MRFLVQGYARDYKPHSLRCNWFVLPGRCHSVRRGSHAMPKAWSAKFQPCCLGQRQRSPARSAWPAAVCTASRSCSSSPPRPSCSCASRSKTDRHHRLCPRLADLLRQLQMVAASNPCPCAFFSDPTRLTRRTIFDTLPPRQKCRDLRGTMKKQQKAANCRQHASA